ncbi:L,D-transpeptidase family protein [Curvivirga sp.]|uniref:L,D-transpeptidase family protein n=1 Tax=Curvivirga sp. TaxID=2856848 RepID=UPI003B598066
MIFTASPDGFSIPGYDQIFPCALGKNGLIKDKREGDNASPIGVWKIIRVLYRADKGSKPICNFPIQEIQTDDGWCDSPEHHLYNQQVKLPFEASHEELFRKDNIYDIVVVLDHNLDPAVPYGGSAIFMHIARDNYEGTAGCIALRRDHLEHILSIAQPGDAIEIKF